MEEEIAQLKERIETLEEVVFFSIIQRNCSFQERMWCGLTTSKEPTGKEERCECENCINMKCPTGM